MQRDRAGQDQPLDVASDPLEVASALAMVHPDHVLLDDRTVVELLGDVMGRRSDQLDTLLASPAVRVGAGMVISAT